MGMSSFVMDCEDRFIDEVSARISGCESVHELVDSLISDKCFFWVAHMNAREQAEYVHELWNEYWSQHV